MAKYVIKIRDKYLEWSTAVDAPVTRGMTREEMIEHLVLSVTEEARSNAGRRLCRADDHGSSAIPFESAEDVIFGNRAGPGETELSIDGIYDEYCGEEEG